MVESRRCNKIPGFSPLLGSPLGCYLISLSRRFIPRRLSDEHSSVAVQTLGISALQNIVI